MDSNEDLAHRYSGDELLSWDYAGLSIAYRGRLNGGGSLMAPWIVGFLRDRFPDRRFARAFEWCCGPGFIGFALLRDGLCDSLCLADVSPEAIACVDQTLAGNADLDGGRVSRYVGDSLNALPDHERFDLVVANPPALLGSNRAYDLPGDRRLVDEGWQLHGEFYANLARHLLPGAVVCLAEVDPLDRVSNPFFDDPRGPWDVRPVAPIEVFKAQISAGGLTLREVTHPVGADSWCWLVVSTMPG